MFPLKDNIPRERFPSVTLALIALNALAYLHSLPGGGSLAGILHVLADTLLLTIFGPSVEDSMGAARYLVFCLLGGLVALAMAAAFGPGSMSSTLACSGAAAAVVGGYVALYPRARVLTMFFVLFFATLTEIPALLLLGLWSAQQIYFDTSSLAAPLGEWLSFAFGAALILVFARRRRSVPPRYPVY
jgi:membrane associated rhomboid family serine protease